MADGPRFSVVIATYNQRAYLLEAVRSVVEQTLPVHEVIVVVDGATDGTAETVRAAYPAAVILQQPNLGKCVARNTGIERATGDWVCFLDHDDLWHREFLETAADHIRRNPGCDALRSPVWFFRDGADGPAACYGFHTDFEARGLDECHAAVKDGDPSRNDSSYLDIHGQSFTRMLERNCGTLSATAVRKRTLVRAGCFSPAQTNGEDWALFLNVARLCEWETLPRRLAFMRLHRAQDTHNLGDGLIVLAGQVGAWFTGRPLVEHVPGLAFLNRLAQYGRAYRQNIQGCLWRAIRRGNFREASLIRACARLLLVRWRDWFYIHVPPPITWRWERYVLGRHK